jgi:4-amino-4-deoxy-L-arabinose transferase-like glycosyltransferase
LAVAAVLALAVLAYAMGLGGQYVPTNGDELVYIHIARLTAEAGHWLPLVSDLPSMRNTKPPLLFWQALWAGDWGQQWTLLALRLPSLGYTLLTAGLVGAVTWRIRPNRATALLAAALFLGFFSTFRYGRPYLTSAPETFWLTLPMLVFIWKMNRFSDEAKAFSATTNIAISGWMMGFTGLCWGLGLAYKSFALIAPTAAATGLGLLLIQGRHGTGDPHPGAVLLRVSAQVLPPVLMALGIFALWFALDPDPRAVWQEFVIGENVGKMGDKQGWWHEALRGGGSSLWVQGIAYLENAGMLFPLVAGGLAVAWRGRHRATVSALSPAVCVLLAWLLVWWAVFMLPSQRSARYVIPAMPALAILLALVWDRMAHGWFVAVLAVNVLVILILARIGWVMVELGIANPSQAAVLWVVWLLWLTVILLGLFHAPATRSAALAAPLLFYLCFGLLTAPLDGAQGRYPPTALKPGQTLGVPSNFNAQWERFEFLLPGQRLRPYNMADVASPDAQALLQTRLREFDAVVWLQTQDGEAPPCLPHCQVVATRWVVKERHKSGDITWANLWRPQEWLFTREWLLQQRRLPP